MQSILSFILKNHVRIITYVKTCFLISNKINLLDNSSCKKHDSLLINSAIILTNL